MLQTEIAKRKRGRPPKNGAAPAKPAAPVHVDRNGLARCRVCGCTEMEACEPTCSWVEADLCDSCQVTVTAVTQWFLRAHRPSMRILFTELSAVLTRDPGPYLNRLYLTPIAPATQPAAPRRRR